MDVGAVVDDDDDVVGGGGGGDDSGHPRLCALLHTPTSQAVNV